MFVRRGTRKTRSGAQGMSVKRNKPPPLPPITPVPRSPTEPGVSPGDPRSRLLAGSPSRSPQSPGDRLTPSPGAERPGRYDSLATRRPYSPESGRDVMWNPSSSAEELESCSRWGRAPRGLPGPLGQERSESADSVFGGSRVIPTDRTCLYDQRATAPHGRASSFDNYDTEAREDSFFWNQGEGDAPSTPHCSPASPATPLCRSAPVQPGALASTSSLDRAICHSLASLSDVGGLPGEGGWMARPGDAEQASQLLQQIQEANKDADHTLDFVCRVSDILCFTLLVTLLIGVGIPISVAMIIIGIKHLDDCPRQPKLPVYLLVGGCVGLLKTGAMFWRNVVIRRHDGVYDGNEGEASVTSGTFKVMDGLMTLFLLGWLGIGSYWTFSVWWPSFRQLLHDPSNWCEESVYMLSVFHVIGCFSIMAICVLVATCLALCYKYTNVFEQ